jgi:hypothetical protein
LLDTASEKHGREVGMANLMAALILAGGMVASVWAYGNLPPGSRWHGFRVADTIVGAVEEATGDVVVCTVGSQPTGCVRLGSATMPTTPKAAKEE